MIGENKLSGASGCVQPDVLGWELEAALARLGEGVCIERAVPPRGAAYERGVWRVVRQDAASGRVTAAFFPTLAGDEAEEEKPEQ